MKIHTSSSSTAHPWQELRLHCPSSEIPRQGLTQWDSFSITGSHFSPCHSHSPARAWVIFPSHLSCHVSPGAGLLISLRSFLGVQNPCLHHSRPASPPPPQPVYTLLASSALPLAPNILITCPSPSLLLQLESTSVDLFIESLHRHLTNIPSTFPPCLWNPIFPQRYLQRP